MKTVRVLCGPRERFPGFGAIGQYFLCNQPVTIDVDDQEYAELTGDPASSFLLVEVVKDDSKPTAASGKK
jgi:hypothetical protein